MVMNSIKVPSEASFKIYHTLPENIGAFRLITQESDERFLDNGSGFSAAAYFSDADNTLLIVFKGTDDVLDYLTDAQLAVAGYSNQDRQALSFAARIGKQLRAAGKKEFRRIYSGHSLGGYLAQLAGSRDRDAQVIVFNAPGTGGMVGNRNSESLAKIVGIDRPAVIPGSGHLASNNVYYLPSAWGHNMEGLYKGLYAGQTPITPEQYGAILGERILSGDMPLQERLKIIGYGKNFSRMALPTMRKVLAGQSTHATSPGEPENVVSETVALRDLLSAPDISASRTSGVETAPPAGLQDAVERMVAIQRLAKLNRTPPGQPAPVPTAPQTQSLSANALLDRTLTLAEHLNADGGGLSTDQKSAIADLFRDHVRPDQRPDGEFLSREILLIAAPPDVRELVHDLRYNRAKIADRAVKRLGLQLGKLMGWTAGVNPSAMREYRDDLLERDPTGAADRQHLFEFGQQQPFSIGRIKKRDLQTLIENLRSIARWRKELNSNNAPLAYVAAPDTNHSHGIGDGGAYPASTSPGTVM